MGRKILLAMDFNFKIKKNLVRIFLPIFLSGEVAHASCTFFSIPSLDQRFHHFDVVASE